MHTPNAEHRESDGALYVSGSGRLCIASGRAANRVRLAPPHADARGFLSRSQSCIGLNARSSGKLGGREADHGAIATEGLGSAEILGFVPDSEVLQDG